MPPINFTNDKFYPTPLPEICMRRKGVLSLYKEAEKSGLASVCAPAGYGKTVSALLYIKDSERKSIWIGLDEYDNAPFVFFKLLCTGILSVQPNNIKMQEILNSPGFYSSPVEHTINFLMEFIQENKSYVLVLDDLHTITNHKILKSIPYILKRMPHSFFILLLSRNKLPSELSEFAENKGGLEITAKDLAFSEAEIKEYYSALGREFTEGQAHAVLNSTGGWPIGINALFKSDALDATLEKSEFLADYITKNIWDKWDSKLQTFMLLTSLAYEMDAELCCILTGRNDAEEILDKLLIQNLFAVKTSSTTYRYHHLFSEFLREKLKERTDIDVQNLLTKIAGLYYKRQDYFISLAYYVRAEDYDGINRCFYQLNTLYRDLSVEEWINCSTTFVFDRLPEEFIYDNITLLVEAAWASFLNGKGKTALKYIDFANAYISLGKNQGKLKENDLLGLVSTIGFADFRIGIYEFSKRFSEWTAALPQQYSSELNLYTPSMTQNFPYMHRSISDCLELIPDMDERIHDITEVFKNYYPMEAEIFFTTVKAGLYYEQNKLEKAKETITQEQYSLKKELRFEIRFCVFIILSQILDALGKAKESEETRASLSSRIKKENALYLNPNFLAIDTKQRLWDADKNAAKLWLDQYFVTVDDSFRFYKLYQYFTTARAYIVLSDKDKAIEYIEKLQALSLEYCRPLDVAEAGVLKSSLNWAIGLKSEAEETLKQVLLAMQPYSVIRIIADEGSAVLPILKSIAISEDHAGKQRQLDVQYLNQVILCAYEVSKRHIGITAHMNKKTVKLSKQQRYILSLLAEGYSNAEIVKLTGLTINTVKSHTKLVYQKLNVGKASDAVIEAKSLGILEP